MATSGSSINLSSFYGAGCLPDIPGQVFLRVSVLSISELSFTVAISVLWALSLLQSCFSTSVLPAEPNPLSSSPSQPALFL